MSTYSVLWNKTNNIFAESVGFEPTLRLSRRQISRLFRLTSSGNSPINLPIDMI